MADVNDPTGTSLPAVPDAAQLSDNEAAPVPGPAIDGSPELPAERPPQTLGAVGLSDMGEAPAPEVVTEEKPQAQQAEQPQLAPEEIAKIKQQNPALADWSDEDIAALASEMQSDAEKAKAGDGGYSLSRDLRSAPGAVAWGAAKGFALEPFDFVNEVVLGNQPWQPQWRQDLDAWEKNLPVGSRVAGTIGQFAAGYIGLGKVAKVVGFLKPAATARAALAQGAVRGAATDFLSFDGKDARLSNLINEHAPWLANPITEYLAADPKNDSELEGRLKNALEGAAIGVPLEGLMYIIRAKKAGRLGDREKQADLLEKAQAAFAKLEPEAGTPPRVTRAMEPEAPATSPGQQAVEAIRGQAPGPRVSIEAVDPTGPSRPTDVPSRVPNPSVAPEAAGPIPFSRGGDAAGQDSVARALERGGFSDPTVRAPEGQPQGFSEASPGQASVGRGLLRTGLGQPQQAPVPGAGGPDQAFQGVNRNVRSVETARQRSGIAADESVRNALARYERIPKQVLPKPRVRVQAETTAKKQGVEYKPVPAPPNHKADADGMLAKKSLWGWITGRADATEQQAINSVERALDRFERLNTPATISDMGSKLTIKPDAGSGSRTAVTAADTSLASRLRPANDVLPVQANRPQGADMRAEGVNFRDTPADEAALREGTGTVVDRLRALGVDVRAYEAKAGTRADELDAFASTKHKTVGLKLDLYNNPNYPGTKKSALEHEEIHFLREGRHLTQKQWQNLVAASRTMVLDADAAAQEGFAHLAGKRVDEVIKELGYEDFYRSQGWSEARIQEALDQEAVAFMVGNRMAGELPNTPAFRDAAETIGMIRDSSIAAKAKGIQMGPTAEQVASARTGQRGGYQPPEWVPRPINEDTPLLAMRKRPHPGTLRKNLTPFDAKLVDNVVEHLISTADQADALKALGPSVPTPSRFDSLTREGQIRAVIETTEEELLKKTPGTFANRGAVSMEETYRLAQSFARQVNTTPEEIINRFMRDGDKLENFHARLFAMRQYQQNLANEIETLRQQFRSDTPDWGAYRTPEEAERGLRSKLDHYAKVQDMVGGMISETGRALNAMRYSRGSPRLTWADQAIEDAPLNKLLDRLDLAKNDPEALGQALQPTRYEALRDFVFQNFIRNALSGFETHIVNTTSSAIATAMHPLYKVLGGFHRGDQAVMHEGVRQYTAMMNEAGSALGYAVEAFKRGHGQFGIKLDKFGNPIGTATDSVKVAFGVNKDSPVSKALDFFEGFSSGMSTRALSAQDEFFKRVSFNSEVLAAAQTDGIQQGLKGAELEAYTKARLEAAYVDDLTLGKIPNPEDPLARRALEVAKEVTYSAPAPGESLVGWIKRGQQLPWVGQPLKYAVPFANIVHNLMHYTASLTPGLAHITSKYRKAIEAGGSEAAVAVGKLYVGSALWLTSVGAAVAGYSRGTGPKKHSGEDAWAQRQMLEQRGRHFLGVDIPGGLSLNAKRWDPFGLIVNVPAIVAERIDDLKDEDFIQWAGIFSLAMAETVLDRHVMTGVSQLVEALSDPTGRRMGKWMSNIAATTVIPNMYNQINSNLGDPLIREASDWFETMQRRLPIASQGLAARRTPWGEPMVKQGGIITSHKDNDKLLNEYARLVETGNKGIPEPLPRMKQVRGEQGSLDLVEFRLKNGTRLYDLYGDRMQDPNPGTVPPLRKRLENLIASSTYQRQLIDGPGDVPGTKLFAIRRIISGYREAAWTSILRDYPEVRDRVYGKRKSIGEQVEEQRRAVELEAYGLDQ